MRNKTKTDYARLNSVGTTEELLEEGQIQDSPLKLNPSDDEFGQEQSSVTTGIDSRFVINDGDTSLDYEDDLLQARCEAESVVTIQSSRHDEGMDENEPPMNDENDIGVDEVWQHQERIMKENREKRERLRKRLIRQKQLAEEKLQEEQERMEMA